MTGPVSVPPGSSPVVGSGVDFFAGRYLALLAERDALASELAALRDGVEPGSGEAVERLAAKAAEVAGVSAVGYGEALDALMRAAGYVPKSERALSPLVQLKRDAVDRKRLADENDRLRAELAAVRLTAALSVAATDTEETP